MGKVTFTFCLHSERDRDLIARLRPLAEARALSAEVRAAMAAYYGGRREAGMAEVLDELRELKAMLRAGVPMAPVQEAPASAVLPAEVADKLRRLGL